MRHRFFVRIAGHVYAYPYHLALQLTQERPSRTPFEEEQLSKERFLSRLQSDLGAVLTTVSDLGASVLEEHPAGSKKAKDVFQELSLDNLPVQSFIRKYNLTGAEEGPLLARLTDFGLGKKNENQTWSSIKRFMEPAFIEKARSEAQRHMHELGFTPEVIRRILPPTFAFQVAPDKTIVREFSVFGNQLNTEERKSRAMAKLLDRWNDLATRLNEDLESTDPITRLSAIVASIVVNTGIRPGMRGESKLKDDFGKIVRDDEGKPIRVETVGATGLKPEHIQFVRDDYARLEFPGKAGTRNVATLTDPQLIRVLRNQIETVTRGDDSDFAFVTEDGRKVTPKRLNAYIQGILGPDIVASDFRKLRATQRFYDSLRERKSELADKLRDLKLNAKDSMKDHVLEVVLTHLEESAEEARKEISHTDVRTTIESYISPKVVLHYLSNAGIDNAIDVVVGEGNGLRVKFDPIDFYNKVRDPELPALKAARFRAGTTMFDFGQPFTNFDVDDTIELLEEEA